MGKNDKTKLAKIKMIARTNYQVWEKQNVDRNIALINDTSSEVLCS
jgi:hypothetical protein